MGLSAIQYFYKLLLFLLFPLLLMVKRKMIVFTRCRSIAIKIVDLRGPFINIMLVSNSAQCLQVREKGYIDFIYSSAQLLFSLSTPVLMKGQVNLGGI